MINNLSQHHPQHPLSLESNAPQSVAIRIRKERGRRFLSRWFESEFALFTSFHRYYNWTPGSTPVPSARRASNVTRKRVASIAKLALAFLALCARVRRFKNTNKSAALHRRHMTHRWPVTDWFSAVTHSPSVAAWRTNLHRHECGTAATSPKTPCWTIFMTPFKLAHG